MQDNLGDRMKRYEGQSLKVMPRTPCIIRVDGRAFHSLLRGSKKPFDPHVIAAMNLTATSLIEEIGNVKMAYIQSDEISLLLTDYATFNTQQWFDGVINKMVSISASVAAVSFSFVYGKRAAFDSRVFSLPKEEVCNYFIWRQKDWERNSVQMLARSFYSAKELQGKKIPEQHDMILAAGGNWNDLETSLKRGRVVTREGLDNEPPIFTQDRNYIERFLEV
jgi:tRNA(His) guanylyltransferase